MLFKEIFNNKKEMRYFINQLIKHNSEFEFLRLLNNVLINDITEEDLENFFEKLDRFNDVQIPDNYDYNKFDSIMLIKTIRHGYISDNRRLWLNNIIAIMMVYTKMKSLCPKGSRFSDFVRSMYNFEYRDRENQMHTNISNIKGVLNYVNR